MRRTCLAALVCAAVLVMTPGGDDRLEAGAGDDTACGWDGVDRLEGQDGDDVLAGGPGRDRLEGGAGTDHAEQGG